MQAEIWTRTIFDRFFGNRRNVSTLRPSFRAIHCIFPWLLIARMPELWKRMLDCQTTGVLPSDGEASTNMGFRLCRSLFYPPNFRISNFRLCLQNWIALPHPALPFRRPLFASPLQRPLPSESPKLKDDTQDLQRVDDSVSLFDPPRVRSTLSPGDL